MAKRIDELPLYSDILEFTASVSALTRKPPLCRNFKLRNQITDAADSIEANFEEGFEQGTDRAFARYVTIAKGSLGETLGHLRRAYRKELIAKDALDARLASGESLGKKLGGFIKFLHRSDFKDLGHHLD